MKKLLIKFANFLDSRNLKKILESIPDNIKEDISGLENETNVPLHYLLHSYAALTAPPVNLTPEQASFSLLGFSVHLYKSYSEYIDKLKADFPSFHGDIKIIESGLRSFVISEVEKYLLKRKEWLFNEFVKEFGENAQQTILAQRMCLTLLAKVVALQLTEDGLRKSLQYYEQIINSFKDADPANNAEALAFAQEGWYVYGCLLGLFPSEVLAQEYLNFFQNFISENSEMFKVVPVLMDTVLLHERPGLEAGALRLANTDLLKKLNEITLYLLNSPNANADDSALRLEQEIVWGHEIAETNSVIGVLENDTNYLNQAIEGVSALLADERVRKSPEWIEDLSESREKYMQQISQLNNNEEILLEVYPWLSKKIKHNDCVEDFSPMV